MVYQGLPPQLATATLDTTGNNPGSYTAQIPLVNLSYLTAFECYHLTIDGPVGFGMSVYADNKKWSHTAQGWQNEWDPSQPLLLNSGQTLYFYFAAPATLTPVATVTAWFRHDAGIPGLS